MPVTARHTAAPPTNGHRSDTVTLPDGRTLRDGHEFTVKGRHGRFAFRYGWNGDIVAWGPLDTMRARSVSFRPDADITIKRRPKDRR